MDEDVIQGYDPDDLIGEGADPVVGDPVQVPVVPDQLEDLGDPAGPQVDPEGIDLDGDGVPDLFVERFDTGTIAVLDRDHDGLWEHLSIDMNGDGTPELELRTDGNTVTVRADEDGDGVFERQEELTVEQLQQYAPELWEFIDVHHGGGAEQVPAPTEPLVVDGQVVGDPSEESVYWFEQAQNGFCVPASVAQIVAEYTGVPFTDELAFVDAANQLGVWGVGPDGVPGMLPEGALTLLEAAGVPASLVIGSDLGTLERHLAEGYDVMLFVDSGEYWTGETTEDNAADHAIVITGIDHVRGVAILSDPGHPEGNQMEVPLDVFLDAWDDSSNTMIVTEQPAPDHQVPVGFEGEDSALSEVPRAPAPGADGAPERVELSPQPGPSGVAQVTSWITRNPWVLLPVALGIGSLVTDGTWPIRRTGISTGEVAR